MVSFTITEKGYASPVMRILTELMYRRFTAGAYPVALVSMDNCSRNGEKLQSAVLTFAREWVNQGSVPEEFIDYLETSVSFPWSMIDKITPRPAPAIADALRTDGAEDMDIIITMRQTYIAPFVNAEAPQYLVIEDDFPNGRPPLDRAGVIFTNRETVNLCERMKVTTCLNPLHTALAVYGCLLGYTLIADEMRDPALVRFIEGIGYGEGMPVVDDPGVISPREFIAEVLRDRLPNPFIPDTPQRIACDTSQKVGIRFGETIKSYAAAGRAGELRFIPLAIAGWLRYLLALDDELQPMELSADPMLTTLCPMLEGVIIGGSFDAHKILTPILSNAALFGSDLYEVGLGERIEGYFAELCAGKGAVRDVLNKYSRGE
jgi:fructuronate reductase